MAKKIKRPEKVSIYCSDLKMLLKTIETGDLGGAVSQLQGLIDTCDEKDISIIRVNAIVKFAPNLHDDNGKFEVWLDGDILTTGECGTYWLTIAKAVSEEETKRLSGK